MALSSNESQQIGRIEAKVDILVEGNTLCGNRLRKLESGAGKIKGALAILSLLFTAGCAWYITGCAHMKDTTYYPTGEVKEEIVSIVIGTGETTLLTDCENGERYYSTRDTGLSDNAVHAVEAGVTATPTGAAAGVLNEILE